MAPRWWPVPPPVPSSARRSSSPYRSGEGMVLGAIFGTLIGAAAQESRVQAAEQAYARHVSTQQQPARNFRRAMGACMSGPRLPGRLKDAPPGRSDAPEPILRETAACATFEPRSSLWCASPAWAACRRKAGTAGAVGVTATATVTWRRAAPAWGGGHGHGWHHGHGWRGGYGHGYYRPLAGWGWVPWRGVRYGYFNGVVVPPYGARLCRRAAAVRCGHRGLAGVCHRSGDRRRELIVRQRRVLPRTRRAATRWCPRRRRCAPRHEHRRAHLRLSEARPVGRKAGQRRIRVPPLGSGPDRLRPHRGGAGRARCRRCAATTRVRRAPASKDAATRCAESAHRLWWRAGQCSSCVADRFDARAVDAEILAPDA